MNSAYLDDITNERIEILREKGYLLFHDLSFKTNGKIRVYYKKTNRIIAEISSMHNHERIEMQLLANRLTKYVTHLAYIHCFNEGY